MPFCTMPFCLRCDCEHFYEWRDCGCDCDCCHDDEWEDVD